jgi:hypothetical protein
MGCEALQVILKVQLSLKEVEANLLSGGLGIFEDSFFQQEKKWKYFQYRDKSHIIEIEISERDFGYTNISCRFAICHPDSIEYVFFEFLYRLSREILPINKVKEVLIFDEVPENMSYAFNVYDIDNFKSSLSEAIKIKRRYWILDFGNERATLTCDEAIKKFILKQA